MRPIKRCLNCQDEREIVAHGLCAKCYMWHRREQERRGEPSWVEDRLQKKNNKELNTTRTTLSKKIALLDTASMESVVVAAHETDQVKSFKSLLLTFIT